jgi:UDP-glucose 4-epimerase
MITVAVTGSSGKLGRHVVRDLHEHGYRTVALDRVPDPDSVADAAVRVDFTDHGQVVEAFTAVDDRYDGVDAVVHLAAIPAPGLTTNAATFANNITATYNVFAAARPPASATSSGRPARPCWVSRSTCRRPTSPSTRNIRCAPSPPTRW